ncbi:MULTISPECIES: hypothetical protein [unclassified Sinorhizobium]|uniref:hypothetical protein n=1 Tax=unclassified Sinorhizobium TaxID=2613772 RepID=UPI003523B918
MRRQSYNSCKRLAEHYKAIGQTEIYLDSDDEDLPWHLATSVAAGGSYRLNGPSSARVNAHDYDAGLTFTWHFDFEGRDANGTGVNQFSADAMLGAARKLPPHAREQFAKLLHDEVWPAAKKHTDDIRDALRKQEDSMQILQSIMISSGLGDGRPGAVVSA